MRDVTEAGDGRHDGAGTVPLRSADADRAARHGLDVGPGRVVDGERDDRDSVAVAGHVVGGRMVGDQPGGEQQVDVAVPQVQGALPGQAGLRSGLPDDAEAERGAEVVRGLPCVTDEEFDVVDAKDVHSRLS